MIKNMLLVAAGGAAGSMLRYLVSFFTSRYFNGLFPLATFLVNMAGCFLIGVFIGLYTANNDNQAIRMLLITGFCGGFTTFSAFSFENLTMINEGNILAALGYIFASVVLGCAAVWLGLKIT